MIVINGTWKVYAHQNRTNGKLYIGITSLPLRKRFESSGTGYKRHNVKFWRAIQKYGWNNFDHILIADNLTESEANNMEALLIEKLDTIKNGYNCRGGGEAGKLSEETKVKIREKRSQQIISRETIAKSAEKNKGKKRTEEFKSASREFKKPYMKSVLCVETGEVFESITEAAKAFSITKGFISMVCNGKISSAHGYHFCFVNSND